jgi:hypothetical protein
MLNLPKEDHHRQDRLGEELDRQLTVAGLKKRSR